MSYLLDTNACIALMNGAPPAVRSRFEKAIRGDFQIYLSSVVTFELWYGIAKSARVEMNTERLELLLSSTVVVLPFENEDSRVAGMIRGALEAAGRPIGAYDYLIAGQALARQLTLVTANVSEFSRVKGLQWQDWAKP
ncbi:MAG: type II toxin-antitoxin system VapC family toxin [Candidatus Sulfotelmatobacter sp.]|jgi:tRNA(fMet)-specific endonuclease VapC